MPVSTKKIAYGAAYLLVALLPWLWMSTAYDALVQAKLTGLIPYAHWDPYDYLLEARSLAAAGLHMGRFTLNEVAAPLGGSPFGPHSFMYPLALSLWVKVLGPSFPFAAPVLNLGFLTLCLGIYLLLLRPGVFHLGFLALALLSLFDFLHTGATFWQDSAHTSLAILMAALFQKMLAAGEGRGRARYGAATLAVLVLASLTKVSWGLLFPAWFLLMLPAGKRYKAAAFVSGGLCFAVTYGIYMWTASPFVNYSSPGREATTDAIIGRLPLSGLPKQFYGIISGNARNAYYLIVQEPFVGVMAALFPLGCLAVWLAAPGLKRRFGSGRLAGDLAWVHGINLGGYLAAAMAYQSLEIRHLFPCYLLSLLLLVQFDVSRVLAVFMLGAQIAMALCNMQWTQNYAYQLAKSPEARLQRIERFSRLSGLLLPYTSQSNAWCNTVLVGNHDSVTEYLGLPPGIGLSHVLTYASYAPPAKSRFLLLKNDWQSEYFKSFNRLEFIAHTTAGDLYFNEDCPCQGGGMAVTGKAGPAPDQLDPSGLMQAMARYPFAKQLEVRDIKPLTAKDVYEASLELDIPAMAQAQREAGLVTPALAARLGEELDRMALLVDFVRTPGEQAGPQNLRLYVHCRNGLFNTYDLQDAEREQVRRGLPLSPVDFKYNELDLFICQYW